MVLFFFLLVLFCCCFLKDVCVFLFFVFFLWGGGKKMDHRFLYTQNTCDDKKGYKIICVIERRSAKPLSCLLH